MCAPDFVKCFPILCNEILIGVGNMVINIVLGRQSEQAIAAIAVFRTLEGLVIGFFSGFSNAASVLVGKSVGAGDLDAAYQRAKRLVLLCGSCIFLLCATLLAVHRPLLTVMSLSGESLEIGTGLLMIYSVAAVIRMCNWTQNDTYRSAGDAAYGTILEHLVHVCAGAALRLPDGSCLEGAVLSGLCLLLYRRAHPLYPHAGAHVFGQVDTPCHGAGPGCTAGVS